jgi:hypothetical protein
MANVGVTLATTQAAASIVASARQAAMVCGVLAREGRERIRSPTKEKGGHVPSLSSIGW